MRILAKLVFTPGKRQVLRPGAGASLAACQGLAKDSQDERIGNPERAHMPPDAA